jgi:hypothetical protein
MTCRYDCLALIASVHRPKNGAWAWPPGAVPAPIEGLFIFYNFAGIKIFNEMPPAIILTKTDENENLFRVISFILLPCDDNR